MDRRGLVIIDIEVIYAELDALFYLPDADLSEDGDDTWGI